MCQDAVRLLVEQLFERHLTSSCSYVAHWQFASLQPINQILIPSRELRSMIDALDLYHWRGGLFRSNIHQAQRVCDF
jgi:hypothetical protein